MSIFFSLKNRLSPMFCFGNANIGLRPKKEKSGLKRTVPIRPLFHMFSTFFFFLNAVLLIISNFAAVNELG